jgi:transcriptional regulator with XRE-family HTH domain
MGHLERGEKNVSFSSILRVANALDVSLGNLFAGIESEDEKPGTRNAATKRTPNARKAVELGRQKALRELASAERALASLKEFLAGSRSEPYSAIRRSRTRPGGK